MYLGAAVLAWTAVQMMLSEPVIKPYIAPFLGWTWVAVVLTVAAVLLIGYVRNARHQALSANKKLSAL